MKHTLDTFATTGRGVSIFISRISEQRGSQVVQALARRAEVPGSIPRMGVQRGGMFLVYRASVLLDYCYKQRETLPLILLSVFFQFLEMSLHVSVIWFYGWFSIKLLDSGSTRSYGSD